MISDIFFILQLFFALALAGVSPSACDPTGKASKGATVKFYGYPLLDKVSYNQQDFLLGGYQNNGLITTLNGVTSINYDSGWPNPKVPYNTPGISVTNFTMEVTGYFLAPQTGVYQTQVEGDDSVTLFIGAGQAFDCCAQTVPFKADTFISTNVGSAGAGLVPTTHETYMQKGLYYSIKLVYINYMERAALNLAMKLPDGSSLAEVGPYLHSYEKLIIQIVSNVKSFPFHIPSPRPL